MCVRLSKKSLDIIGKQILMRILTEKGDMDMNKLESKHA